MSADQRSWLDAACGAALGAAVFFLLMGASPLEPMNIRWLLGGDPSTYYLGGAFFQESPWTFPPGLNPRYGLDVPSSIYLTDSVPLLGYPFKLLRTLTGEVVQYMGVWLLLCFTLQGVFGWLLAAQFTPSIIIRFSATLLMLFLPAFLARTLQLAQYPTSAHFIVIAALVIYFSKLTRCRPWLWIALAVVSILSQSYLYAMAMGIWAADVVRRGYWSETEWRPLIYECVGVIGASFGTLWLSGFFIVSSGLGTGGYGMYQANLLSIFDSKPSFMSWSYVLPPTPKADPGYNASNFYGAGALLLVVAAIAVLLANRSRVRWNARWWPLAICIGGMLVFALSHKVSIGSYELTIPVWRKLVEAASVLRVSDRFVWPFMYVSIALSIFILSRSLNSKVATAIFVVAAAVQVADTHRAWSGTAGRVADLSGPAWPTVLTSPFWHEAGSIYRHVRRFPIENSKQDYEQFAYFALKNGMSTNAVYQSRIDVKKAMRENAKVRADLAAGQRDPDSLYVLDDDYYEIARRSRRPSDLLETIDGFHVLAPDWHLRRPASSGAQRR